MRKYAYAVLLMVLAVVVLTACSGKATEVSFSSVCDPENANKNVSTVGYFAAGGSIYCSNTGGDYRCGLDFVEEPGSENRFTADVLEGDGDNELAPIPEDFSDADIRLKTDDGEAIGVGEQARISGEMLIGEGVCLMTVDKIEAVAE